jgi:diaminohydroxyphosphoribosylaminopyrimidine deaminase/5-amino-6-(5-phosphoribosylamino)uracil reductase
VRAPRVPPRRVVFDRDARLPLQSRLVRTAGEAHTVVVTRDAATPAARALAAAGVEVVAADTLEEGLRALAARGVHALLVEGGAGLAGALLGRRLVDRLVIFQAPVVLGAGSLPAFGGAPPATAGEAPRLRLLSRRAVADDLLSIFALREL